MRIDWSERLRGNWGTSLSPFGNGAVKATQNFADFLAKFAGQVDDGEGDADDHARKQPGDKAVKFDKMGNTLNAGKNVKPGKGALH